MDVNKDGFAARIRPVLFAVVSVASLVVSMAPMRTNAQTQPPGGFIEQPTNAQTRPRLSAAQIQSFLPARGEFTFPAPYHTQGVRLTNAADCGGSDCLWPVGYSYWRNINNHTGSDTMYIFLGLKRGQGGGGPTLFSYNKPTGQVSNLGALFDPASALSWATGEGWYFSASEPTTLYLNDGPRMRRYDVLSGQLQTVFDVRDHFGSGYDIWQMHSSDDDRVHSATLRRTGTNEMLGCLVYREDSAQLQYFPKAGSFDECHVDKSGRWLMSLEDCDGQYGLEMRIIDLQAGTNIVSGVLDLLLGGNLFSTSLELINAGVERLVYDQNGAVGHADMGYGYVVGTDNWNSEANAILSWDFALSPLAGNRVFYNLDWYNPPANHISHANARPDTPINQQYACGSNASSSDSPWVNEVVCFRLDGSYDVLVAAPVMTDMNSSTGGDSYAKAPKGNLDVTGRYFIWTSNTGGARVDAFLVKIPAQLLVENTGDTPEPDVISPPSGPDRTTGSGGGCIGGGTLIVMVSLLTIARRRRLQLFIRGRTLSPPLRLGKAPHSPSTWKPGRELPLSGPFPGDALASTKQP